MKVDESPCSTFTESCLFFLILYGDAPIFSMNSSVRSYPIWRALFAPGGASEPMSLLPFGPGLRSGSLFCPSLHGAERPAARTR